MPDDDDFDFDEVWATGAAATPNVPPVATAPFVPAPSPRPVPKVKPVAPPMVRKLSPKVTAPEEEEDTPVRSASGYVEATDEFLASLVGLTVDDAVWKCLRAGVNCRTGVEDGEECVYNPDYFPAYRWRPYTGPEFIVEKDIVVGTRRKT